MERIKSIVCENGFHISSMNFIQSGSIVKGNRHFLDYDFFDSIVVVGSSGSGKTTLINSLRNMTSVSIPKRLVTRPPRLGENSTETNHITNETFMLLAQKQEFFVHWARKMENHRVEKYGILKPQPNRIPVLSGNNALFNNIMSVQPENILAHSLYIGIFAPDEIRANRLLFRSPDLFSERPDEISYRINDSSRNIIDHSHIIVNNYGSYELTVVNDFYNFIKNITIND